MDIRKASATKNPKTYAARLLKEIRDLKIGTPTNGLENWLLAIELSLQAKQPNMTAIMHEFACAYYSGIVEGVITHHPEKYVKLFSALNVDDVFMQKLFDAMTAKHNRTAKNLVFKFPEHTCTDDTLQNLASAMRNPRFPRDVVLDFSQLKDQEYESSKFSDAGVNALLEVLRDENCMVCANIYFNNKRGFITPEKLIELDLNLTQCRQRYEKTPKPKSKTLAGLFPKLSKSKKTSGYKKLGKDESPRGPK